MRSILIHLSGATEKQVIEFLTQHYTRSNGSSWISEVDGDACLYLGIYRDMEIEFGPEEVAKLSKELGSVHVVSVIANVSGRHPGDEQVRELISRLLSEFNGLAQDEYTEGFWTLDEICSEQRKPGLARKQERHTFFDYSWESNA